MQRERESHGGTAGLVLAGGAASRLGTAAERPAGGKAAVLYHGRTFLEHVVTAVAAGVGEVVVVAAAGQPLPSTAAARVVRDTTPGAGPLAGIRDGLRDLVAGTDPPPELVCVASCDVPLLRPQVVRRLVAEAGASGAAWTVPVIQGHAQVLLSVMRSDLLPRIEAWLAGGRRDLRGLCVAVAAHDPRGVRELSAESLRALDPALESFLDVDTVADLDRLLAR